MIGAITEWINNLGAFIDSMSQNAEKISGAIITMVLVCERIARIIPTNWDNRSVDWIAKKLYIIFAVLGLKVPDIVKVDGGMIITKQEAVAQQVIDLQNIPSIDPEPKA